MPRKTALLLGGSVWQTGIIEKVREFGLRAIVADISPVAPGRCLADVFVQIDTNDREGLLAVARAHAVDLVVAEQTDRVVPVAAFINEQLGLGGIQPGVAHKFTDKWVMRNALLGTAVRMPRYLEISTLAEGERAAKAWGFPVILKPKQSQSSLGVFKVRSVEELSGRFSETMSHATDGRILIEEFISGTEITVEAFSAAGHCYVLAVSEKEHYPFNDCVACRLTYPPDLPPDVMERVYATAELVVNSLGLQDGISHAEYRLRAGFPYLIEVAARGGGNRIASVIVPHVSGVDAYRLMILRLLNQEVAMPPRLHRSANLEFLNFHEGKVKAIHGLEAVQQENLAHELWLSFGPGDTLRKPTDDRNRLGYFIVLGETRSDVDRRSARIKQLVQVEYE